MEPLVVRTADFRLAYHLCEELGRRKVRFELFSEGQRLPHKRSVWLGTPEEVSLAKEGRGIGVVCEHVVDGLFSERAIDELDRTRRPIGFSKKCHGWPG